MADWRSFENSILQPAAVPLWWFSKFAVYFNRLFKGWLFGTEVEFFTFNDKSTDVEIAPLNKLDKYFSKSEALEKLDKKISKAEEEVRELQQKRKYFESTFHKYFEEPVV